jgi:hypothetical protein
MLTSYKVGYRFERFCALVNVNWMADNNKKGRVRKEKGNRKS